MWNELLSRMHSNKMSTVHCSGRRGGGCLPRKGVSAREGGLAQWMLGYSTPMNPCENITLPRLRCGRQQYIHLEQDCIQVGCVLSAYCPYLPACTVQGGSAPGGWYPSMHCAGGGLLQGVGIPACTEATPPPHPEQNDRQVKKYYLAPNFVCGQ